MTIFKTNAGQNGNQIAILKIKQQPNAQQHFHNKLPKKEKLLQKNDN